MHILSATEISSYPTDSPTLTPDRARGAMLRAVQQLGLDGPAQTAGHFWSVACVSLEISQRCNLDCSLCYLSDQSEATHDVPLAELERRIASIATAYGAGTVVQISGGEPTLRRRDELVAIVRDLSDRGLTPALFTNGIRASRDLLSALKDAGLRDVAFHVDMTQNRRGYETEEALNALRLAYIERAQGLGLRIMFNTTVFAGNYSDVPGLARFFVTQAHMVELASFQIQAETGRGLLRSHDGAITQSGLMQHLGDGAGVSIPFDLPAIGHPDCNKYAGLLVVGGRVEPLFDDPSIWSALFSAFRSHPLRAHQAGRNLLRILKTFASHPVLLARFVRYVVKRAWSLRWPLLFAKGRTNKVSFHIHNFMDETRLEKDRCEACVFKVVTGQGALSMCVHNAKRDTYILKPVPRMIGGKERLWDPLTGQLIDEDLSDLSGRSLKPIAAKQMKGRKRARQNALAN